MTANSFRRVWFCVAVAIFCRLPAPTADATQKTSVVQSDVLTRMPAGNYPRPLKCGPQGSTYFLGPEPTSGMATALAGIQVTRVNATGNLVAFFPPQLPSGVEGPARYVDFAGDGSGGLLGLIDSLQETGGVPKKRSGPYLAKFSADGNLDSINPIDVGERFVPRTLELMANGQLFVTGLDRVNRMPQALIFDSNGRTPLKVENTMRLEKGMSADAISALHESLRQGSVAPGIDGNIYLVGRSERPVVLVIASNGQLSRYFFVRSPAPEFTAVAARQNGSQLAIAFAPKNSTAASVIRIIDTTTRATVADYPLGDTLKGQLACFADNGSFSILVMEGQGEQYHLKTVAP